MAPGPGNYTWVHTTDGAIIYRRWEKERPRGEYLRHSQLGGGRPVLCAGEMRVEARRNPVYDTEAVVAMVDDSSGHYKPVGRACLPGVAKRLEEMGISTAGTEWCWYDSRCGRECVDRVEDIV